jgi:hypothetical protein
MGKIIILLFCILASTSCRYNSSSSQAKESEISDYNSLSFGTLEPGVIDSFMNHSKSNHVLVEPGYYVWGLSVIKWNGEYHAYYSRWNRKYKFEGWMTQSEIAHAVSPNPEGPFEFVNVVLNGRKTNGWDFVNSHNPYAVVADGKICLYYISDNIKALVEKEENNIEYPDSIWFTENSTFVRNSQCIGLAIAENPSGPFIRSEKAVVKPDNIKFKNIAVNPAVLFRNKQYTMVMKGDDLGHEEWFRIQLAGTSENPEGPFNFALKPVYDKAQTEDACIWFDNSLNRYYMVCHVLGKSELALFNSENGIDWQPDERRVFMKKEISLSDGTVWKPDRVERPFVLTDKTGRPVMIYVAIADRNVSGNIAIPIKYEISE